MNKERLKRVQHDTVSKLNEAVSLLEQTKDEEQEDFDNLSEGQQEGTKGETMSQNIDSLDNAINTIEGIISDLEAIE